MLAASTTLASLEARLIEALRSRGDAKRAEWEKAYQKSPWEHWDVPLPGMDAAIREALGDLSQKQALDLCRHLCREPVWDLKIVAGRILARKSIEPNAKVWSFVTERLPELDGWAVANNLAARRVASSKTPAGSTSPKPGSRAPTCGRGARRSSSPCRGRRRNPTPRGCSAGPRDWRRIQWRPLNKRPPGGGLLKLSALEQLSRQSATASESDGVRSAPLLFLARLPKKPKPAKPSNVIAQVDTSGAS